jgi:MFS family permease
MITDAPETKATLADWLAVAGAIVGAFTAILDIQITNSSLANIEGAIGASEEQGSWISTAYLMAEIVVIPLTAGSGRSSVCAAICRSIRACSSPSQLPARCRRRWCSLSSSARGKGLRAAF